MYPNLRSAMEREGYSVEELADAIGVHRNTVQNKLSGGSDWTYPEVSKIQTTLFPMYQLAWLFRKFTKDAA